MLPLRDMSDAAYLLETLDRRGTESIGSFHVEPLAGPRRLLHARLGPRPSTSP